MKYEIIKGSEKDFEGLSDGVIRVFKSATGSLLYSDVGTFVGIHWSLIAERRPITEPELKPIYGDGIHDDSEALQQRIDMAIDVNNIIGEQGKLFNISKPLQFGVVKDSVVNQQLTTEWDGEGLPPVGALCEYHANYIGSHAQYEECEIIAHFDGEGERLAAYVYTQFDGTRLVGHGTAKSFRPISSPEDVARDEAIAEMRVVGYTLPAGIAFSKEEMAAIYDAIAAGKIPGIKLEN